MNLQPCVYLLRREDGLLLYIGSTDSWARRMKEHSRTQWWWDEVASVELRKTDTIAEARLLEGELIGQMQPQRNLIRASSLLYFRVPWSDDEIETVRREAHKGAAHLSDLLDRSVGSIYQKAQKLGISVGSRSGKQAANE